MVKWGLKCLIMNGAKGRWFQWRVKVFRYVAIMIRTWDMTFRWRCCNNGHIQSSYFEKKEGKRI